MPRSRPKLQYCWWTSLAAPRSMKASVTLLRCSKSATAWTSCVLSPTKQAGTLVRSKGDDVLCTFADPSAAMVAVRAMLSLTFEGSLRIHAGVHFGPIIHARGDIFGDAVNLTARLAALANPGEALISQSFAERLGDSDIPALRVLEKVALRGKSARINVYALQEHDVESQTAAAFVPGSGHTNTRSGVAAAGATLTLAYAEQVLLYKENARVSIGRSTDCDILIPRPWVSRHHATVTVQRGRVQIDDRSSSGDLHRLERWPGVLRAPRDRRTDGLGHHLAGDAYHGRARRRSSASRSATAQLQPT